jgi:hypothetical protein
MTEIGEREAQGSEPRPQHRHLLMRDLEELAEQAELLHQLERRGVDRVAAEVAEEVGVLFQHDDIDTRARQQQAEHHAGRPAANDAAGRMLRDHSASR